MAVTNLLLSALIAGPFGAILTRLAIGAIASQTIGTSIVVVLCLVVEDLAKRVELPLLRGLPGDAGRSGGLVAELSPGRLQGISIGGQLWIMIWLEDVCSVVLHD